MRKGMDTMSDNRILLAVDGNSILNRAFYGVKPLTSPDGRPTNAVYGFFNIILKVIDSLSPSAVAVAFDLKAPTFRHEKCDYYKANRHGMPDDLAAQLEPTKEIIRAMGYKIEEIEGYEADDILGTCAENAAKEGHLCYILTGDRDSFQLVSENCTVLLVGNNDTVTYTPEKIRETYGVEPKQMIEVKALMGDSSDNIPGVPGIGEKTALKLITAYGSLDGVYENYENAADIAKGVKAKLEAGRDSAYESRFLAEICTKVPLDIDFESLKSETPDNDKLYSIFTSLGLKSLIKRTGISTAQKEAQAAKSAKSATASFFDENDGTTINTAAAVETVNGISPCADGEKLYVHISADGKIFTANGKDGAVYECEATDENIKSVFGGGKSVCSFSVKDTELFLMKHGAECTEVAKNGTDLMLMSYVADPADKNDADSLCLRFDSNAEPDDAEKCRAMPAIEKKLAEKLSDMGGTKLYTEIELPLADVLAKMEYRGVKLDTDGLKKYGDKIDARLAERQRNIYELSETEFNINSPKQLGDVLFVKLGLPGIKKTKSGFSTDAETLERLRSLHPVINEILDYRLVSKLRSTYVEGLLDAVGDDGRLHTNFKQAFTLTGRLSSAEPNLQNIPIRKPEGRELRRFFVPEDSDHVLIDADYSQIELRLLAAISGDKTMTDAFIKGIDIHSVTASQVFGVPLELVTPELRKKAKAVNFGIVYGISDYSLAGDIGTTVKEAGRYIDSYFEKYSAVKEYLDSTVEKAERDGYVTTLYGRRRYIPELSAQKKPLRAFGKRVAMNTPIQGTAADIIKIAMVRTEKALDEANIDAKLILQVHDELLVEASKKDAARAAEILKHEMESAASLTVPLSAELEIGDTWYDAHG